MQQLEGKAAFVTGAGSGIGRAIADSLARRGVAVAVADIDLDAAEQAAKAIANEGGRAVPIECDVTDEASLERASDAVTAALKFQTENRSESGNTGNGERLEVRIGIALGEVVIADNTVTGAGVVPSYSNVPNAPSVVVTSTNPKRSEPSIPAAVVFTETLPSRVTSSMNKPFTGDLTIDMKI